MTKCNECGKLCTPSEMTDDKRMCKDCYIKWLEGQFKELKKDNEGYEKDNARLVQQYNDLQKENAGLKLKLEALDGQTPWKDIKDKSEVVGKLTKAKEIIKELYDYSKVFYPKADFVIKAEQFLNKEEK